MKVFLIINKDSFFLSHRKEIAICAKNEGYEVVLVAKDTGYRKDVESLGIRMIDLPINSTGKNLLYELKTFLFLYLLYRKDKPEIVHHVGLKIILWGGLAAKFAKVTGVLNAVSGLGVIFSTPRVSFLSFIIISILRFSHNRKNIIVVFQNNEDKLLFVKNHIITKENTELIKGSGINLNLFSYTPESKTSIIKVLFMARMIKEKGVLVLIEAAEMLRAEFQNRVQFLLCGGLSDNPHAIKESELKRHSVGTYIQWLGHRNDVADLLRKSHIVAFPSYYREGIPKSLIEATAIGRPIITTDSVGCKDVVIDRYNGFLVPIKNSIVLAEKLKILITDEVQREIMGKNSRLLAENYFSLDSVIEKHLKLYMKLRHDNAS